MRAWGGGLPTHIFPVHDIEEHDTDSLDCWCNPDIEEDEGETIVLHNAGDEREKYATGERKTN